VIRDRLVNHPGRKDEAMAQLLDGYGAEEVKALLANLGGHDLGKVMEAYAQAFATQKQPVVIFAYTIRTYAQGG
jgi:pyruvate dehydrogenase E1 component